MVLERSRRVVTSKETEKVVASLSVNCWQEPRDTAISPLENTAMASSRSVIILMDRVTR